MKVLSKAYTVCMMAFIMLLVLSWFDVILHNVDPNPVYQPWNLFGIFVDCIKAKWGY